MTFEEQAAQLEQDLIETVEQSQWVYADPEPWVDALLEEDESVEYDESVDDTESVDDSPVLPILRWVSISHHEELTYQLLKGDESVESVESVDDTESVDDSPVLPILPLSHEEITYLLSLLHSPYDDPDYDGNAEYRDYIEQTYYD